MRQMTQQAIQLALESKWDEAIAVNQELLRIVHPNSETLNRLGKAFSELGRYTDARRMYTQSLELDPDNVIAHKNVERLAKLGDDAEVEGSAAAERIDPSLFIEEVGKTGVTALVNLACPSVIARLNPGDEVYLKVEGHAIFVRNARSEQIGQIEPILANRLIRFITAGNQYAAAIKELSDHGVQIIIRETYLHPSQLGKVSFPSAGPGSLPRSDAHHILRDQDEDLDDEDEDFEDVEADDEAEDDADATPEETEAGETE